MYCEEVYSTDASRVVWDPGVAVCSILTVLSVTSIRVKSVGAMASLVFLFKTCSWCLHKMLSYMWAMTYLSLLFSYSSFFLALRSISSVANWSPTGPAEKLLSLWWFSDSNIVPMELILLWLCFISSMCSFRVVCTFSTLPSICFSFSYILMRSLFSSLSRRQSSQSLSSSSACLLSSFLWWSLCSLPLSWDYILAPSSIY